MSNRLDRLKPVDSGRVLASASRRIRRFAAPFSTDAELPKFKGAIGVDPLTAASGVDTLNVVRGISPGGRAWVIRKLDATVHTDAGIVVKGKGLLFSIGEVIATRGPVAQVVATLACGPADATAAKYSSEPAPLGRAGNFKIQSRLSDAANIATLPQPCENPQLPIRAFGSAGPGGWFAAGILDSGDDD